MTENNTVTRSIESITNLLEGAKNHLTFACSKSYMEGYIQGMEHALDVIKQIAALEADRLQFEAELQAIINRKEVA
jgi:hypothetical protein